ncbi:hypothetical F-215 22.8 kDa protein [Human mastadenovirus C]|uniref:Hypothetical F-215 22.8 kDa protein n=1 Tax=Human mastadenovirus C TaxID=129951 RepID=E1ARQ0_9ADEN|nr:hypothetical F-215 22.8 kDa protein [Human mastadenovirus C]
MPKGAWSTAASGTREASTPSRSSWPASPTTSPPPWSEPDAEISRRKRSSSSWPRSPIKTTQETCRRFCARPPSTTPKLILSNSLSGSSSPGPSSSRRGARFRRSTAASSRSPATSARSTSSCPRAAPTCLCPLSRRVPSPPYLRGPARVTAFRCIIQGHPRGPPPAARYRSRAAGMRPLASHQRRHQPAPGNQVSPGPSPRPDPAMRGKPAGAPA